MSKKRAPYFTKVHLAPQLDDATKYHRSHLIELGLISRSQWDRARHANDPQKLLVVEDGVFCRGRQFKDYIRRQAELRNGATAAGARP